jgi:hypothetical protein
MISGETKTDTLDSADENYMFGALAHLDTRCSMLDWGIEVLNINLKPVSMQGRS